MNKVYPLYKNLDIVIVEERTVVSNLCRKFLSQEKLNFHSVTTFEEAKSICIQKNIYLLLLDGALNTCNVFNLLKVFRLDEVTENIPVIIVSDNDFCDDVKTGIELGVADYILSPFLKSEFREKILKAIKIY